MMTHGCKGTGRGMNAKVILHWDLDKKTNSIITEVIKSTLRGEVGDGIYGAPGKDNIEPIYDYLKNSVAHNDRVKIDMKLSYTNVLVIMPMLISVYDGSVTQNDKPILIDNSGLKKFLTGFFGRISDR